MAQRRKSFRLQSIQLKNILKMKNKIILLTLAVLPLAALAALAANVTGTWKSAFDSQIGNQKYTFTFKQDGTNLTGKASSEITDRKREADLKEGKVDGDAVSFVELMSFQGNDIRITYTGKLATNANEINFTREVGEIAKETIVAKREPAASPEPQIRRRGNQPIVLGPDDKAAFPKAPEGFDKVRDGIAHGKLEMVEYDSKSVGNKRKTLV